MVTWKAHTAVATASMAVGILPMNAVSILAPYLVADLGLPRVAVGGMVTASFAVAAVVSLVAGRLVDELGARRGLMLLASVVAAVLLAASAAPDYRLLVAAVAVAGLAQALANPTTNVLLAGSVPPSRRGVAVGIKQSGVQLAALASGVALPALAAVAGWRAGFRVAAVAAALLLVAVARLIPERPGGRGGGAWWRWERPQPWLAGLMGYSLLLGIGLAAVNSYLPLYATQRLGLSAWLGGLVLATFGLAGLVGRVGWSRWADRLPEVTALLAGLAAAAAVGAVLLWLAGAVWGGLVWLAAVAVGATATAANAISMLLVVRRGGATGHASGLVSLGFFTGFVIGPTGFGLLADHGGYGWGWIAAGCAFVAAAVAATRLRRQQPVPR